MPQKQGEAVPEDDDSVPRHDELGPDQPILADIYRLFEEIFDRQLNLMKRHFDLTASNYGEDERDKSAFSRL